jgi:ASC-1-like (ASCH) protein
MEDAMFELEKMEVPTLPEEWSYDESLDRMKSLVRRFSMEIVLELFQAWRILHLSPAQAAKVRYTKEETHTWKNYCESLSISQKTVYNWFVKAGLPYRAEVRGGRRPNQEPDSTPINRDLKKQFEDFVDCVWVNRLNGHRKKIKPGDAIVLTKTTLEDDVKEVADVLSFGENGEMLVYHGSQSRLFIKRSKAIGYQVWVRK